MKIEEIEKALENKGKIIFGFEPEGLREIWIEDDKIEFTSDTRDYKMNDRFEEVLETLFSKFGVYKFEINMHHHEGKAHDKDISFKINKPVSEKAKIIQFIMNNFYDNDSWDCNIAEVKNERR